MLDFLLGLVGLKRTPKTDLQEELIKRLNNAFAPYRIIKDKINYRLTLKKVKDRIKVTLTNITEPINTVAITTIAKGQGSLKAVDKIKKEIKNLGYIITS